MRYNRKTKQNLQLTFKPQKMSKVDTTDALRFISAILKATIEAKKIEEQINNKQGAEKTRITIEYDIEYPNSQTNQLLNNFMVHKFPSLDSDTQRFIADMENARKSLLKCLDLTSNEPLAPHKQFLLTALEAIGDITDNLTKKYS